MKRPRTKKGLLADLLLPGIDDKRLAIEALALEVRATPTKVEVTAIIPVDITTTGHRRHYLPLDEHGDVC